MSRRHGGPARPAAGHADLLDPYRHLALRVIAQAWRDLFTSGAASSERESARAFLSGAGLLAHWCELADMDAGAVRSRVHMHIARGRSAAVAGKGR